MMLCIMDRIQQMNKPQDGTIILSTDSPYMVTFFFSSLNRTTLLLVFNVYSFYHVWITGFR